jgi:hypothetical protein
MIELEPGKTLDINLKEDTQGRDRVILTLSAQGCDLVLTPHQARVLATELIMAVNRAAATSSTARAWFAPRNHSTRSAISSTMHLPNEFRPVGFDWTKVVGSQAELPL